LVNKIYLYFLCFTEIEDYCTQSKIPNERIRQVEVESINMQFGYGKSYTYTWKSKVQFRLMNQLAENVR